MSRFDPTTFFPRSSGSSFCRQLVEIFDLDLDQLANIDVDLRNAEFHPSGERRVDKDELIKWRDSLNEWAYDQGFPSPMNLVQRNNWDVDLGVKLLDDLRVIPESSHPGVMCWIAVHLLPHFIVHRWGWPEKHNGQAPTARSKWARFGPDPRNGLRVAMHRVRTYGPDIARRANQEEFQSIQNRPAFSLDSRVARAILSTIVDALEDPNSNYAKNDDGQRVLRRMDANLVGIELRLINSMRPLCFVSDDGVAEIVRGVIAQLPELRTRGTLPPDEGDSI